MRDIESPKLMWIKAGLFVLLGLMASATILLEHPHWKIAGLLVIVVWSFARAYYFAFHVIEHYIDEEFRYRGLGSLVSHVLMRNRQDSDSA